MDIKGVSGKPADKGDCPVCAAPNQGLDLQAAGYHPNLKGTRRLKSPRLGKLRTCRQCGRLWSEHFDQREGYTWFADLGLHGVDVLLEQADPVSLVNHAARQTTERSLYWMPAVAEAWIKREPDWAAGLLHATLASLRLPIEKQNEIAAERRLGLVRLAGIAVSGMSAGRQILFPPTVEAICDACTGHVPSPQTGLAYLGKTMPVVYNLACFQTMPPPAMSAAALIEITDFEPVIQATFGDPLPDEDRGYLRGQRLLYGFNYLHKLRDAAGRWFRKATIVSMPEAAWRRLDQALDPVLLAADIVERLLGVVDAEAETRRDMILESDALFCELVNYGARMSDEPLHTLNELLDNLKASDMHADKVASQPLEKILRSTTRAAQGDCTASSCECAG